MAEQTYDLTQEGADVQAIINDANNMKGAGAQTTLTDESVLLKDTNGQYHKILKSSFTEAIRDTLAGLLVNNDKGTTINQIAAIASGDFGSITPANLASVLGVGIPEVNNNIQSLKDYFASKPRGISSVCWLLAQYAPSDAPENTGGICFSVNYNNDTNCVLLIVVTSSRNVWLKTRWGSSWSTWHKIMEGDIEQ